MTVNHPASRGLTLPIHEPQSRPSSSSGTAVASAPQTPAQPQSSEFTHTEYDDMLDVEDDLERPLHGYPKLARLIAQYPDFEAFQSFKDLNIKSLLYYQAELAELRKDLHRCEWKDYQEEPFARAAKCCVRADVLIMDSDDETRAKEQMKLMKRIRRLLKEYNAALLQYSQISALPEADGFNVNSLRTWLAKCPREERIQGPGADTWGKLGQALPEPKPLGLRFWHLICSPFWTEKEAMSEWDLIVPRAGTKADGLARWVANEFVPFWQCMGDYIRTRKQSAQDVENGTNVSGKERQNPSPRKKRTFGVFPRSKSGLPGKNNKRKAAKTSGNPGEATLNTYRESRMLRFTSAVATIIACLLPTVAISVLAKLHTTAELLGIIAVFTAVFAAGLMLLVDSGTSRVEIFTATAAFSAVMVVFVQNQESPYPQSSASFALNSTNG